MTSAQRDDQLARIVGLIAADLAPGGVGHVVRQRDEVEAGAALRRAGGTRSRTSRVIVASPSDECSAWTWKSPAYQPACAARRSRCRTAREGRAAPPTTGRSRRRPPRARRPCRRSRPRPARRPPRRPARPPTPPPGSGRARKPRVVLARGGAAWDSRGTPPRSRTRSRETVTSGWLDPPQPRNSGSAHGAPGAGRASRARGRARA